MKNIKRLEVTECTNALNCRVQVYLYRYVHVVLRPLRADIRLLWQIITQWPVMVNGTDLVITCTHPKKIWITAMVLKLKSEIQILYRIVLTIICKKGSNLMTA